ncbi:extracellular solute-binding protein [Actinomadura sp. ATCC 31491]|uniref:Extracellular solute-binding protein n=1 Tax=Actinomadura luzonensis TaxID=2805427 RepID=A0ABT0FW48_9ACTN|nr:extracellular solute-binding protein [Actinomadura luzonensis]MCK2216563.1 extracellular solute-binding protein [Actinomadura luzonensis]
MRRTPAACCTILVAALSAACATSGQKQTQQADQNAPMTLSFWSTGGDDETATFQKAADLYHQKHPNVTVKVQTLSWDDAYAKLLAAATSRTGPDILSGGMTWTIQFGARGAMVDLREHGIDALKGQAQPAQWESAVSPDGSVYGVPLDMSTMTLYYRTDLLKEAGLDGPPTTWQELVDDIGKLKAAGVKKPYSQDWGNLDWIGYFNYLYQAGGAFYTPDCKPSLNTPQAERALTYWVDLYRKHGAPTATVEGSDALDTGTAMVVAGNWIAKGIDANKPKLKGKWAMAALPAGPAGPTTFIGGRAIGVTSYSKYARTGADFVRFMYSDEAIAAVADEARKRNISYIPPRPDKIVGGSTFTPEQAQVFAQAISTGKAAPGCPGWDESASDVAKQLQSAILGKSDVRTALTEAAKVMQRNAG